MVSKIKNNREQLNASLVSNFMFRIVLVLKTFQDTFGKLWMIKEDISFQVILLLLFRLSFIKHSLILEAQF